MIEGEFKLIESIKERVDRIQKFSADITGIGDDCAVYRISDSRFGLFSADISAEDVHFDLGYTTLFDAGYRSMTANVSDIIATGGRPVLALISLGIPDYFLKHQIDELYDGILACASRYGAFIAGGDISVSAQLTISISIYGETSSPILRSGAKPGDRIYLTGNTGLSKLGLEILGSGSVCGDYTNAVAKHLRPEPRSDLLDKILKLSPTSMIDISDGLLIDLSHICEMSGCGFELFSEKIPVDDEITKYCQRTGSDPSIYTLQSGEEYELLFTSKQVDEDTPGITNIGFITESDYIITTHGFRKTISINGYDHFKNTGK